MRLWLWLIFLREGQARDRTKSSAGFAWLGLVGVSSTTSRLSLEFYELDEEIVGGRSFFECSTCLIGN